MDRCASCRPDLTIFEEAWQALGFPTTQSLADVEWDLTSCKHADPLALRFAQGATKYWVSAQIVNANYPVVDLWVRKNGATAADGNLGKWSKMVGQSYNYFTPPVNSSGVIYGMASDFKIDCSNGASVVLEGVKVEAVKTISASGNC